MVDVELPDFDDMVSLSESIGNLKTQLMVKNTELDILIADITTTVTTNKEFWVNGRPPTNIYIKNTYQIQGYNESTRSELAKLRMEIAELEGNLNTQKNLFKVYNEMVGVWRTQSANQRRSFLE